jgi:hypothetical protein
MMLRAVIYTAAACLCFALPVDAQRAVASGTGATLRILDKVSGQSENYELATGGQMRLGPLTVLLRSCRYPDGNVSGDAFAYLDVFESDTAETLFSGWMIASAPALNAMEHSRYDVWVLRCKTS